MNFDYHRCRRLWLRPKFYSLCVRIFPKLKKFLSTCHYKFRQALFQPLISAIEVYQNQRTVTHFIYGFRDWNYVYQTPENTPRGLMFISLFEISNNTNYTLNNPCTSFLLHWHSKFRLLFLRTKNNHLKNKIICLLQYFS